MTNFVSVYMTASSPAEAEKIATALIEEKLAACVNLFPGVRSIYRFEGKLEKTEETVLIAKTRAELVETLKNRVKALHSYSCPCILVTPITGGHQPYLAWMVQETTR